MEEFSTRQQHFLLSKDDLFKLESLSNKKTKKSDILRKAIDSYWCNRFIVIKIECIVNEKVLIFIDSVDNFYKRNYLIDFSVKANDVGFDIQQYGVGEFRVTPLGVFRRKPDAINYKVFIMNFLLDKGTDLYNNEIFTGACPRYIIVNNLPIELVDKLTKFCVSRGTTASKWFTKIVEKLYNKDKK